MIISRKSVATGEVSVVKKRRRAGGCYPSGPSACSRSFPPPTPGVRVRMSVALLEDSPLKHSRRANEAVGSTTTVIQQHLTSFASLAVNFDPKYTLGPDANPVPPKGDFRDRKWLCLGSSNGSSRRPTAATCSSIQRSREGRRDRRRFFGAHVRRLRRQVLFFSLPHLSVCSLRCSSLPCLR